MNTTRVSRPLQAARHASPTGVPLPLWPVFLLSVLGLFTSNPLLTVASIGSLALFIRLLWCAGEPPALLFAVLYQWVAVTAEVFQADWRGVTVNANAQYATTLETTIWMSLFGLLVLTVGLRLGKGTFSKDLTKRIAQERDRLSIPRVAQLYAASYLFSVFYPYLLRLIPPGRQIFAAAADVRWAFFFLLAYLVFSRREKWAYFFVPFLVEFIGGIGFFAGFKVVFFFAFVAILFSDTIQVTLRTFVLGTVLAGTLLFLGLLWTTIKNDLRDFLSQGATTQAVRVSEVAKYRKVVDLAGRVDVEELGTAFEPMLERVAYVDIFSAAVDHVPDQRPYTGGEIWENALVHIFKPRIFFPDKNPLINDAVRTMRYTGLRFSTQATSVSMGYMANSYVDFGPYLMYIPIFLLGYILGLMYRFFVRQSRSILLGFGMSTVILIQASNFGMEAVKLIGSTVMIFLVFSTLLVFADQYVVQWMMRKGQ